MLKSVSLDFIGIALMALLLIVETKSIGELNGRIAGDQIVKRGQFSYQVSVRKRVIEELVFTFLRRRSHKRSIRIDCLKLHASDYVVGYDSSCRCELMSGGTTYAVPNITNHLKYNLSTIENGISMIRIVEKILFTLLNPHECRLQM